MPAQRVDVVSVGNIYLPVCSHKQVVGHVGNLASRKGPYRLRYARVELRLYGVGIGRGRVVVVIVAYVGRFRPYVVYHKVVAAGIGNDISVKIIAQRVASRVLQIGFCGLCSALAVVKGDAHHLRQFEFGACERVVIEPAGGIPDTVVDIDADVVGVAHFLQRTVDTGREHQGRSNGGKRGSQHFHRLPPFVVQ